MDDGVEVWLASGFLGLELLLLGFRHRTTLARWSGKMRE
jgi:hypothetical protein